MFEGHSLTGRSFTSKLKIKPAKKKKRKRKVKRQNDSRSVEPCVQAQDSCAEYVHAQDARTPTKTNAQLALDLHAQEVRACTKMHVQYVQERTAKPSKRDNMTISLTKELRLDLNHYPEINWSEVAREAFKKKLLELKGNSISEEGKRFDSSDYLYT